MIVSKYKKMFLFTVAIGIMFYIFAFGDTFSINASAAEVTGNFTMTYGVGGNWNTFNGSVITDNIDSIKIQSSGGSSYFLQYATHNSGKADFYPAVNSNINDYAGAPNRPVQKLLIRAFNNDGTKINSNIVVMYRTLYNGNWLPWVSNANPEWMECVQEKYNLGGTLDSSSWYAGVTGSNIGGVEIHIFEEETTDITVTPVGNYKIINAPFICQNPSYPTGCESVSTVMALQYHGIDISVDTFIDNYLNMTDIPFDPNISFGGNPRTGGYGCYSPVIKNALDKVLADKDFYALQLKNVSLQNLCSEYIDNNIPVILWATDSMQAPKTGNSWIYNGETITWIVPEHCLLLVGYDDNNYIFNDPLKSTALKYYNKAAVETAYAGLYSQSVVILNGLDPSIPVEPQANIKTGDTGAYVLWIQKQLNLFGYSLAEDGIFQTDTNNAVLHFQRTHNLQADGIVGANTRAALKQDPNSDSRVKTGDSDMDGNIDIKDLIRVKRYIADNDCNNISLYLKAVDFDSDGKLNSTDIAYLKKTMLQ